MFKPKLDEIRIPTGTAQQVIERICDGLEVFETDLSIAQTQNPKGDLLLPIIRSVQGMTPDLEMLAAALAIGSQDPPTNDEQTLLQIYETLQKISKKNGAFFVRSKLEEIRILLTEIHKGKTAFEERLKDKVIDLELDYRRKIWRELYVTNKLWMPSTERIRSKILGELTIGGNLEHYPNDPAKDSNYLNFLRKYFPERLITAIQEAERDKDNLMLEALGTLARNIHARNKSIDSIVLEDWEEAIKTSRRNNGALEWEQTYSLELTAKTELFNLFKGTQYPPETIQMLHKIAEKYSINTKRLPEQIALEIISRTTIEHYYFPINSPLNFNNLLTRLESDRDGDVRVPNKEWVYENSKIIKTKDLRDLHSRGALIHIRSFLEQFSDFERTNELIRYHPCFNQGELEARLEYLKKIKDRFKQ
jgi:hypothetical protein